MGTVARRMHCVNRRQYSVAAPRSLYHIDGYRKLIVKNVNNDCVVCLIIIVHFISYKGGAVIVYAYTYLGIGLV